MSNRVDVTSERPTTRSRLSLFVLLTMTAIGVGLCAIIVSPFVPGLVWALSLAVVALPVHRRVAQWIRMPTLAAAVSTLAVTLMLLVPALVIAWQVGNQVAERVDQVQHLIESGAVDQMLQRFPPAARLYRAVNGGSEGAPPQATDLVQPAASTASAWLQAAGAAVVQILIALFVLFFLFRDRQQALDLVRSLMPMSDGETDYFFEQIRSMTHATIYGTLVVSAIQGGLGGLMFALLGIPGALLWGLAMALLSIIPSAGAFVIWIPAALILAAQGEAAKAIVLAAWGALAVGTIDNLLYPLLVGKEVRLHTLPVFLAIVGGLVTFGAAGIVIGPVVLAATIALIDILRRRTAHGRSAAKPR